MAIDAYTLIPDASRVRILRSDGSTVATPYSVFWNATQMYGAGNAYTIASSDLSDLADDVPDQLDPIQDGAGVPNDLPIYQGASGHLSSLPTGRWLLAIYNDNDLLGTIDATFDVYWDGTTLREATAYLTNVVGSNGSGLTEVTLADETITADKFATDAISAGALSTAAVNEIATAATSNTNLLSTTVATVTSQTALILTAGPDFTTWNTGECFAVITDATNNDYPMVVPIQSYIGSTKTLNLVVAGTGFTIAAGDGVSIYASNPNNLGVGRTYKHINQTDLEEVSVAITRVST